MKKNKMWFVFSVFFGLKRLNLLFYRWQFVLVVFLCVSVGASAQQQKVSIDVTKVDVSVIFREIKEQTKLNFVYDPDQLTSMSSVTLRVQNVTVDSALSKLFAGTVFEYRFEMQSILIRQKSGNTAGRLSVSGVVMDMQGLPLPGVAVIQKGTTVGTATDSKGKFQFTIAKGEKIVLIFSFIGMKRIEVPVKEGKPMEIKMEEEVSELGEVSVISTGYWNVDKRHLTSAVTSLKAEDILVVGMNSIDQMLEGHVPGMIFMQNSGQVGVTPKLKIRGTTTLLGSTAPLWVVDGVILSDPVNVDPRQINDLDFVNLLGNAISGLNPQDIDQIDVLKDASATAIYGPKASNGVIVITTKKGKVGAPSVSYSVSATYRRRPRYTDKAVNVMNSKERVDYSREVIEKGMVIGSLSSWVGYEAAIYDLYRNNLTQEEFEKRVSDMETCNTDWFDLLLKDSFSHSHTLSLSGGSDNVRYYTSINLSDDNGSIRKESSKRYSAMANISVNYNKFSMQFSVGGNMQKKNYTPEKVGVADYAYNTSRTIRAYHEDGALWFYQRSEDEATRITDVPFSIINEQNNTYNKVKTDQFSLNASISYQVLSPLKASMQFSYGVSNTGNEMYYGEKTWYAADLRQFNINMNEIYNAGSLMPKGGELRLDDTKNENYSVRGQLQFSKCLDPENVHRASVSLIGELNSSLYSGFKITRRGYMPDRGLLFDKVESDDEPYEQYNNWLQTNPDALGSRKDQLTNSAGLIGVVTYTYKNAYIFNANARIDGSNKFGDRSNKKLLPVWSVSGRWNLDENLLRNEGWVNSLALMASFGYQGNMSNQDSPRLQLEKKGMSKFFREYYSTVKVFPNPFLKWEKTMTFNLGLDFSLFKNKLSGSVSYYFRRTTDAFLSKSVSGINGVRNYTVNRGTLENRGYDFSLSFVPINTMLSKASVNGKKNGFVWRFDPNFGAVLNTLMNKLKSKDKPLEDEITFDNYLNGSVYIPGKPLNTFYSYKYKGLSHEDGRPLFHGIDEKTMVDGEEVSSLSVFNKIERQEDAFMKVMTHSGCREPFLQGGISNYLGWRNWGLSFNLAYSIGSKIRLLKMYPTMSARRITPGPEKNMRRELVNRWLRPGDELNTDVPGILDNKAFSKTMMPWWNGLTKNKFATNIWEMYDQSDFRVASGNYLKMQSLSLRYVFPEEFCKRIFLKSAYLSMSGSNIFTLCSKALKGQDPSQSGSAKLINVSVRPTYSFQLSVTF